MPKYRVALLIEIECIGKTQVEAEDNAIRELVNQKDIWGVWLQPSTLNKVWNETSKQWEYVNK